MWTDESCRNLGSQLFELEELKSFSLTVDSYLLSGAAADADSELRLIEQLVSVDFPTTPESGIHPMLLDITLRYGGRNGAFSRWTVNVEPWRWVRTLCLIGESLHDAPLAN